MPALTCPREAAVIDAVIGGRWPDGCEAALRTHVAGCGVCTGVAAVAVMLNDDRARTSRDLRLPTAGQVWWSATVRARMEAAHAASRPITWMHGLTAAGLIGVAGAVAVGIWPTVRALGVRLLAPVTDGLDPALVDAATPVLATIWRSTPAVLAVMAAMILVPLLVVYVAHAGERGD